MQNQEKDLRKKWHVGKKSKNCNQNIYVLKSVFNRKTVLPQKCRFTTKFSSANTKKMLFLHFFVEKPNFFGAIT